MRLQNKIALITGGARGIGQSCAEIFVKEGATVIVSDINDEKGRNLVHQIGNKSIYHSLNVMKEKEWINATRFIKDKFGKLDILVNNAGITGFFPDMGPQNPEFATLDSWSYVHSVNLNGVFLGCKYGISLMKNHGGSIINISSRSGLIGIPQAAAYASSKAGVRNHTKSVALYCSGETYNIRCNSIHPAAILTPMWDPMLGNDEEGRKQAIQTIANDIPLKTMGTTSDVAYAAVYLASDESKYLTGIELNVDGGILAGATASLK